MCIGWLCRRFIAQAQCCWRSHPNIFRMEAATAVSWHAGFSHLVQAHHWVAKVNVAKHCSSVLHCTGASNHLNKYEGLCAFVVSGRQCNVDEHEREEATQWIGSNITVTTYGACRSYRLLILLLLLVLYDVSDWNSHMREWNRGLVSDYSIGK